MPSCYACPEQLSQRNRYGRGVPADEIAHRQSMLRAVQALNRGETIDESLLAALCEPYVRATCVNGHPWTAEHLHRTSDGRTVCRTCRNGAARARRTSRAR